MLPVVLYGRETWFLTLREKHRPKVFENRVLRRIFGSKREEVTGEWRRTYNEKVYALDCSPNIIRVIKSRRMRWVGHVASVGNMRGAYRVLMRILHGRISIGRPRLKLEDNIEVDVQEVELEGMDWVAMARIRIDNEVFQYARQVT